MKKTLPVRSARRANSPKSPKVQQPTSASTRPSRLADIQRLMAQAIMRPLTTGEGMQRTWTDGTPSTKVAERIVKPNDRLASFERLQIYNQQYWWRLLGSFAEDFRGLRAVLGERKFDRLAVAYLESRGSTSWNLRNVGQHLLEYLREHPEAIAPHTALALDMVRVEWARVEAFDGASLTPIDPQKIGSRTPDRLRFKLQPYITLLELHHPIDHLLRRLREANIETSSASNAATGARKRRPVRLSARRSREPIHIAVHRHDYSVYYKRLDAEAFRLLGALQRGATLDMACGEAFAGARELPEQSAEKIRRWFAQWTQLEWLCARK